MRLLIALILAALYIDMYQDRLDKNKTTIIIERDEVVQTFTIDNKKLNDEHFIEELIGDVNGNKEKK